MPIQTAVRCFARVREDTGRPGIWAMTGPERGVFFHGDKEEMQEPDWSLRALATGFPGGYYAVDEISADEAMAELVNAGWIDGVRQLAKMFSKYPPGSTPEGEEALEWQI